MASRSTNLLISRTAIGYRAGRYHTADLYLLGEQLLNAALDGQVQVALPMRGSSGLLFLSCAVN